MFSDDMLTDMLIVLQTIVKSMVI